MSNIRVEMGRFRSEIDIMNARLADPSGVSLYQIRQIRLAATRAENELKCMGASGVKLEHGHYEATYPPAQSEVTG